MTATYLVEIHVPKPGQKPCPELAWAQRTMKDCTKTSCKMMHLYQDDIMTFSCRRFKKGKEKRIFNPRKTFKQFCGDVGNAYINAYTEEKVYAIAGPELSNKEGCVVIIKKALYGLKTR
jgi:hypothetical protein